MILQVAGIQYDSIVDGPGIRLALFVQGCSHRCPGCHNPETHDPRGGKPVEIVQLIEIIDNCNNIDGVTISGGEPFEQAEPVAALADAVTEKGLDLVVYSGYYFENLLNKSLIDQNIYSILAKGRLLIDGPFLENESDLTLPFRGSRNQRIIDLPATMRTGKPVEWGNPCFSEELYSK
ncbi:MAG: 4Fe-4S single cluster domain-containing protein [Bacillota bacterium]|nr:4Fe-4S single cluster domain-containing protein [Bacillota bacterium]